MCSESRRRRGCAGARVGKPAGGMAARAAATQRGEAGAGQRGSGKRQRGCWGGARHGLERHGVAGARHMAGEGGGASGAEKQRSRGLEVDEGDLFAIS
jgi:hypothetical protein